MDKIETMSQIKLSYIYNLPLISKEARVISDKQFQTFYNQVADSQIRLDRERLMMPWQNFAHQKFWFRYHGCVEPDFPKLLTKQTPFYIKHKCKLFFYYGSKKIFVKIQPFLSVNDLSLVFNLLLEKQKFDFLELANVVSLIDQGKCFSLFLSDKKYTHITITESVVLLYQHFMKSFNLLTRYTPDLEAYKIITPYNIDYIVKEKNETKEDEVYCNKIWEFFENMGEDVKGAYEAKKYRSKKIQGHNNIVWFSDRAVFNWLYISANSNKKHSNGCYHNNQKNLMMMTRKTGRFLEAIMQDKSLYAGILRQPNTSMYKTLAHAGNILEEFLYGENYKSGAAYFFILDHDYFKLNKYRQQIGEEAVSPKKVKEGLYRKNNE